MDARTVILMTIYFSFANSEYLNKKFCQNVDQSKCSVHGVKLDPCPDGPGFCLIRRDKPYRLSFDFTPRFDANKLKLEISSDEDNSGNFDRMVLPSHNACEYHSCPLEEDVRTSFDVDFAFRRKGNGKFPVQVKLWNENDSSQACCFTFNVKVLK